jgi:hypothetical protein
MKGGIEEIQDSASGENDKAQKDKPTTEKAEKAAGDKSKEAPSSVANPAPKESSK